MLRAEPAVPRACAQRWGWTRSASYLDYVAPRAPTAPSIATLSRDRGGQAVSVQATRTRAACAPVWDDATRTARALSGSYRRGGRYKQTFSLGARRSATATSEPTQETELAPGQEQHVRATCCCRARGARSIRTSATRCGCRTTSCFENLSTFGKSENVRVGPALGASVSLPLEAFGSSTNSVVFTGDAGYVLADGDALRGGRRRGRGAARGRPRGRSAREAWSCAARRRRSGSGVWCCRGLGLCAAERHRHARRSRSAADNGLRGYAPDGFRASAAIGCARTSSTARCRWCSSRCTSAAWCSTTPAACTTPTRRSVDHAPRRGRRPARAVSAVQPHAVSSRLRRPARRRRLHGGDQLRQRSGRAADRSRRRGAAAGRSTRMQR